MCYDHDEDYDRPLSPETLRAMAEAAQILDEWEKMQDEEYNTREVIDMLQYDNDENYGDEIPNETTLRAMAEAKQIIADWKKWMED